MRTLIALLVLLSPLTTFGEEGSETLCLTEALYFEARNQSIIGQMAVAQVILERVADNKFPNTVCGVVHQNRRPGKLHKCQFSYWCDGKPEVYANSTALTIASNIADFMLWSSNTKVVGCSPLWYTVTGVKRSWMKGLREQQVGDHTFFCRPAQLASL